MSCFFGGWGGGVGQRCIVWAGYGSFLFLVNFARRRVYLRCSGNRQLTRILDCESDGFGPATFMKKKKFGMRERYVLPRQQNLSVISRGIAYSIRFRILLFQSSSCLMSLPISPSVHRFCSAYQNITPSITPRLLVCMQKEPIKR